MRRIIKFLLGLILVMPMIAATEPKMYLNTEKIYAFTAENLAATVAEYIESEKKQEALVRKWVELMDPETGAVSVADLFAACRAGGFNTYKLSGYEKCREFIEVLILNAEGELDEDFLNGYCPGLDENGKNPNVWASMTDKTRIGDPCSSTNIYAGEITFRKGYNCTCTAYACNLGYEFKKGSCVKIVADGEGNCLRKEFDIDPNKIYELDEAIAFCQDYATKNKCKYNRLVLYPLGNDKIICNATQEEVDAVDVRALHRRDEKIAKLKFGHACGGLTQNPNERNYCEKYIFAEVDTGQNEAAGLAQLYAKEKHNDTVYCDTHWQKLNNDYWMKCATLEQDAFYDFKFDDLEESSDSAKFKDTVMGLAAIYGYKSDDNMIKGPCTQKIQNAARKLGMKTSSYNTSGNCFLSRAQTMSEESSGRRLRTIEGIDNTVAKSLQLQGSTKLRDQLKSYVQAQGFALTEFECDNGYGRVTKDALHGDDDILTCRASGTFNGKRYTNQPIDFVFDDVSEGMGYIAKAGEQGMHCIGSNGKFDGHYCRGLTKEECFQLEKEMQKQGVTSWDSSTDLVDWDEAAGACELNSAQFANNINKVGKNVAIVGLTIGGVVTGGSTTAVAISLMAVELAGMAGEIYVDRKQELLPQQWADQFLKESRNCNNASCAEPTLKANFAKISQASGMLNKDVLNQVDTELARLAEMIPESRIEQIMNSSEGLSCWETWECQRWIFTGMQFASLGVGIGKGLVKLTKVFSKKAASAATKTGAKAATSTASHADDVQDMMKLSSEEFSKRYSGRFADIGIKEERTAAGGYRYRDIKTGRFVSRENVGRRLRGEQEVPGGVGNGGSSGAETGNTGGGATGGATGGASSADDIDDILRMSPDEFSRRYSDRFADIGIKEERTAAGGYRYRDTKTGRFVSREDVARRVKNQPGATGGTGAGNTGANTGTNTGNTGGSGNSGGNGGGATGGASNGTPPGGNSGPSGNTGGGASGGANGTNGAGHTGTGNTGGTSGSSGSSGSGSTGGTGSTGPHETGGGSSGNTGGGNSGPHNNGGGSNGSASGNTGGTGSSSGGNGSGSSSGNTGGSSATGGGFGGAADAAAEAARAVGYDSARVATTPKAILEKWGLSATADAAAIKKRYRQLVMALHPDRIGGDGAIMQMVNNEADVLRAIGMLK